MYSPTAPGDGAGRMPGVGDFLGSPVSPPPSRSKHQQPPNRNAGKPSSSSHKDTHTDGFNAPILSAVIPYGMGYKGYSTVIPALKVAFACQLGDLLLFRAERWPHRLAKGFEKMDSISRRTRLYQAQGLRGSLVYSVDARYTKGFYEM